MHTAWPFLAKAASVFFPPTLGFPAEDAAPRSGGEIGVSAGRGQTPWSAARPRSGGSSVFLGTTNDAGHHAHFKKKGSAQAGTLGGSARVHECIVGSAQRLRAQRNNARARARTV